MLAEDEGFHTAAHCSHVVMPGLVPGIHVLSVLDKDVDGRVKPGHDAENANTI
jgi:hypothetical protein